MRLVALAALAVLSVMGAPPAVAADYPDRAITVVVPFPPGGATDTTARLVGQKLGELLKATIITENRPGATGAIGAAAVKLARPDGYTFMVASIGVYAINQSLFKDLKYNPLTDFDLLSIQVRTPNVLVTSPNFPVNSVAELIAYLKANPGKVTFASSGAGSSDQLTAALFWQTAGVEGVHVPYKGGAPAINDLMGGHADASFQNVGAVAQQINSGKLKALAVTSSTRSPVLPKVPTMAEAGVPGVEVYSWQAAAAPKGLPAEVRARLEAGLIQAAKAPDVKARFEELGFEVVANNGQEFSGFLAGEAARWKSVIERGKITAE
jgi:tripartite-type tricarboxylate transporter receptor subunit TctC